MDTSRVDGVKASLHNGTPRSHINDVASGHNSSTRGSTSIRSLGRHEGHELRRTILSRFSRITSYLRLLWNRGPHHGSYCTDGQQAVQFVIKQGLAVLRRLGLRRLRRLLLRGLLWRGWRGRGRLHDWFRLVRRRRAAGAHRLGVAGSCGRARRATTGGGGLRPRAEGGLSIKARCRGVEFWYARLARASPPAARGRTGVCLSFPRSPESSRNGGA